MKNLILKNGRVVDPARQLDAKMDIGVAEGRIVAPGMVKNPQVIDLAGCVVTPGFIDMHVHLRQPGNTAAETVATGTAAAAAGGFSAIVAMPNTKPAADNAGAIEYLRQAAAKHGTVRVYACGCMTKNLEGKEMTGIGTLKKAGVVAISDDGRCVQDHGLMRHIVEYAKSFNLPVLDHCEETTLMAQGVMNEGEWSVRLGMEGIPAAAEELIVARDAILARDTDWKMHIQHVSCAGSVDIIRRARANKVQLTAEATPHHIALSDERIKTYDSNYKMNPPLRSEADRRALIEGLADGTIEVIATDHAPHTRTAKMVEFNVAPFGIVGLETAIPVCLRELYHSGVLTLPDFVSKFTVGPAKVLNFETPTLEEGKIADITVLDLDREFTVDSSQFKSKSRNTPFDRMSFRGRAVMTVVNGLVVWDIL